MTPSITWYNLFSMSDYFDLVGYIDLNELKRTSQIKESGKLYEKT
jgi:hypothetical protein